MRTFQQLAALSLIVSILATPVARADDTRPGPGPRPGPGNPNPPGGPRPGPGNPTPPPAPTPDPTPAPTPPTGPSNEQIAAARALGEQDGRAAGGREGDERGPNDGREDGRIAGHREGYARCEREERAKQQERGYRDGYIYGQDEGNVAGDRQGRSEGESRGRSEGQNDGLRRADNDAMRDATGPGRQRGYEEANASDADARGRNDGTIAGDQEARAQAERVDYPRGRKDYRDERLAEAVESEDSFNQKNPVEGLVGSISSMAKSLGSWMKASARNNDYAGELENAKANSPDNRYYNPSRSFPSPQETEAYRDGYRNGYNGGFQQRYNAAYDGVYRQAYDRNYELGCQEARRQDYRQDYQRGYNDGRQRGYNDQYRVAYDRAYRDTYNAWFRAASDEAYRGSYQRYYDAHFEAARSAAYRERYDQIYNAAYGVARQRKFNEMYPAYAEAAYKRGRADEAEEFRLKPVQLLDAAATETINNGLFEPGEALRLRVRMRNFSEAALTGRDVKITLQALDAGSAVISEAEASLVKGLKRKSITTVGEALEFRMNENAVNRAKNFRVTLSYQGRNVGEKIVAIQARFMVDMAFAESPELKEGIATKLKVRLRNQSNKATDAGLKVLFRSNPELIEILNDRVAVGILNPGEERVVEFGVIARRGGAVLEVPMVFQSLLGTERRVGLIDQELRIPLVNDYRIEVGIPGVRALRSAGVSRVEYTIRNVGSRLLMKGLQLKVKINGENGGNFAVIGPNPQYLSPLLQGQSLSFVVPILSRDSNSGGVLELEVQEDGRTVIISRTEF